MSFADKTKRDSSYDTNDHVLSLADIAAKHNTSLSVDNIRQSNGLTKSEAAARLLRDGPNALTPPKKTPEWIKFARYRGCH